MNELKIYKDKKVLLHDLTETIVVSSKEAIKVRGQFNFVLSGGSSPKNLYELLASEKFKNKIDWSKTYFFFGDERFVPENDAQRNSKMAAKALFEPLKIRDSHIFKVDTRNSPEEAAQKYLQSITTHFGEKAVLFDFVLLGLGDNGHTASLFPNTIVLEETEPTIKAVFLKEVNRYRITMTAPLINQAKQIAFLVFGKEKGEAVCHVLKDKKDKISLYPARLIQQNDRKVLWFLDSDSASLLL